MRGGSKLTKFAYLLIVNPGPVKGQMLVRAKDVHRSSPNNPPCSESLACPRFLANPVFWLGVGSLPNLNGYKLHVYTGQSLTSLLLPPLQSMQ